ncbi:MAG: NAD-dependent protein deacylase [Calditrichaeota bacterium]|nr:NAD-dependent protein deacylase [Calditrichota bacterium]
MDIQPISPADYRAIVFFTGAGMSAESGVPTYRGQGGIWAKYNWEEVASEEAFRRSPEKVLEFHALRRQQLADCRPHQGHRIIAALENSHPDVTIITQNIDGLHQRAGSRRVIELHGSLWRMRCSREGTIYNLSPGEKSPVRCQCDAWFRPDIIWFGDCLDPDVVHRATEIVGGCDLLIAVGTSAVVWPAAGFPQLARDQGAHCIEVNLEATEMSFLYHESHQGPAGEVLPALFPADITA